MKYPVLYPSFWSCDELAFKRVELLHRSNLKHDIFANRPETIGDVQRNVLL